jgi:hypothetical protein
MKFASIAAVVPLALLLAACEQQKAPQQQQSAPPQAQGGAPFSYAKLQSMPKAADGADGSGCLADTGPLPDGIWYGNVSAWTATSLDFDPACWFTGAEAAKEATKRGEESPPPNDFFIANDSKVVRTIPVTPSTPALRVTHDAAGGIDNQKTTYADMVANPGTYQKCPGEFCPVWIAVNGGVVTEVSMQYLP